MKINFLESLLILFYPRTCIGCEDLLLKQEHLICSECFHKLPFANMLDNQKNDLNRLFYGRVNLTHATSILYFNKNNITQKLIHQLKYKEYQEVGTFIGSLYHDQLIKIQQKHHFDLIIPIPLHKERLKQRGYNQLTFFGKYISEILQIPFEEKMLIKIKNSNTQTRKTLFERTKMDDTVFYVNSPEKHINQHILLIDDVVTTGSTLENALKCLAKIENIKLSVITMAITDTLS